MMLKKDLTEKIVTTWKELKDIRNKQGFRNTDVKLIIKKKEAKAEKEIAQSKNDLNEELEEILTEKNEQFKLEMSLYAMKLKAYKFQQTKKSEAFKRNEKREKDKKPIDLNIKAAAAYKEQQEADFKIMNEEDLIEPVKPADVHKDQIVEDLRNHYTKVRKVPEEPYLFFELIEENGTISPSNQCSA